MGRSGKLKAYRKDVDEALADGFLRGAMEKFARASRASRESAFSEMDVDALVADIAAAKDQAIANMDDLYAEFRKRAEAAGAFVHFARTARDANAIILNIAKRTGSRRVVKSKSMTAEETLLNASLEADGLDVTETDLGEWIIQLRHEGPAHMVMPAIHLSRRQVADLFARVTGETQDPENIDRLVKVARRWMRQKFREADMGITGANFAIAETGTLGIVSNEGNARLVTTLPRVHVALVGLDKLLPSLQDALRINQVLPRNATGQAITSYVTWITGPDGNTDGGDTQRERHIVFLDNGRRALARDPVFSQVLRCVRCGACANVCPVYRMVGGHRMGHIYVGAIGLILTYFYHGMAKAGHLVQNCMGCGACREVCVAGIDLPRLIQEIHTVILRREGRPITGIVLAKVLQDRGLFHRLLRYARSVQGPVTDSSGYLRHLPMLLGTDHAFKAVPALAPKPFRDLWASVRPRTETPTYRVALFAGCLQDFVYPEQLVAGLRAMSGRRVAVDFPMEQTCCGLPLQMMGEREAARDVASQNVLAVDPGKVDYILTLCASCASHLKNAYPGLLAGDGRVPPETVRAFSAKVIPFSSFMNDVLEAGKGGSTPRGERVTYHAPCHLCRGLGVRGAPRRLIKAAGFDFVPSREEETCCGFGGTYSLKFPNISREIVNRKLDDAGSTGAALLVTECPGCVMQLRGAARKRGDGLRVLHLAEMLAGNGDDKGDKTEGES